MELDLIHLEAEDKMETAVNQYLKNIAKIVAGRANPAILDQIKVEYFNTLTPVNQLAQISVPEPTQILIKPYDMNITKDIVGVINGASLGVAAVDEGNQVRMTFPELTQDRRKELVKSLGKYTEQAKVQIRSARQEANKKIKSIEDFSEDSEKIELNKIQKNTDKNIERVDFETKEKEKTLMTI